MRMTWDEHKALAELRLLREAHGIGAARLESALSIICRTLNAPLAKILQLNESGNLFVVRAGIGWREGVVGHATVPASDKSTAGYALRHRRAVIFDDIQRTRRFTDTTLLRSHDVTSSLAIRLTREERAVGVLSVHEHRSRRFTAGDVLFIEEAAHIVADLM